MWTGIEFLLILQDLRLSMPQAVTDFFDLIARGEFQYMIPILLGALFLWAFGKREGEFLLFNFTFSNLIGYMLKYTIKQPRPWVLDPDIQPNPASRSGAGGYSLPSGHTTSALAGYGTAAWLFKNRALKVLFLSIAIIMPFSRMFLGVHTPLDLIVALIVVLAVCYVNYRVLEWSHDSERNRTYALLGYIAVAVAVAVATDLASGKFLSNKMTCLSIVIPVCLLIEERFVMYEAPVSRPLKERLLLAVPGLVVGFALMEGISLMNLKLGVSIYTSVAAVFIIVVYPYLLKRYLKREG